MMVSCNGRAAQVKDLLPALVNYGHFTSLQVRGGAVQGLDLHLARLSQATRELFGSELDTVQVQAWMAQALQQSGQVDASLRVTVFSPQFDFRNPLRAMALDVLVAVGAPVAIEPRPRRVRTACFRRDTPQIKHVGTFPLFQQRRAAMRDGFDDVLFVDADGRISEGSTWNIVFHDGSQLVWPQAPALRGTAEALLSPEPTAGSGELDEIAWLPLDEARALDLPAITRFVLGELAERLEHPNRPMPFVRMVRGRHTVEHRD